MPGFTTHYLFGVDVYKALPAHSIKKMIHRCPSAYSLGLQGPDIFFFYLPCLLGGSNKKLGSIMHNSKVNRFFQTFLNEIEILAEKEREIGLSYLAGFLCHYSLDAIAHPYVYSRTDSDSYHVASILSHDGTVSDHTCTLYFTDHRIFETTMDTLMLKRNKNISPSMFLKERTVSLTEEAADTLSVLLSNVINHTYYDDDVFSPGCLQRVFRAVSRECKILSNRREQKKQFIEQVERRYIKYPLLSSLIPTDDITDETDVLNLSHQEWKLPWAKHSSSTDSFLDLYKQAEKKCCQALSALNDYVNTKQKKNFLQTVGNCSFETGLFLEDPLSAKM